MRQRVTVSINGETLRYVDRLAGKRGRSRSQVIESFIEESRRRKREENLAAQAGEFFAKDLTPEENEEREDWLKMSAEAQKRAR
ncbi:MAG: CopG family transcriptional regulator [Acidobacteriota bacterium]